MKQKPLPSLFVWMTLTGLLLATGAAFAGEPAEQTKDLAARIFEMTGARTKIVWEHQVGTDPKNNWDGTTAEYELVGFDTDEGEQRVILPGPASYAHPSITPDGRRIVYCDAKTNKVHVVDWDGTNKKHIADGYFLSAWVDPETGIEWAFFYHDEKTIRCQIDDPKVREVVWDQTGMSMRFTVSADGTHAGGEFPWPRCGVAMLPNILARQYGRGCNACLAPDNSYRFMHMGEKGGHRGVLMYDDGGINRRQIDFDNVPGREGESSWAPRWTTDVRFLTLSCPIGGMYQEVFLGEFDEKFTRVIRWIQISDQLGQDIKAHAWIAPPGLGYYAGEAPFTVEISPPEGEGQWDWDFGDGTKARGPVGKHTFQKGGRYKVTARQGDQVLDGSVHAYEARPPSLTSVQVQDESHVLLKFDERIQLKDTKFSLASGTPVKGCVIDADGNGLIVEFDGKIGKNDALSVQGVYDKSQVPKAFVAEGIPIARPTWPSSRDGLVFLWETEHKPSLQYNSNSKIFTGTRLTTWRRGRFNHAGAMSLQGGVIYALEGGMGISSECARADRFTVEAAITPANLFQGWSEHPHWIIACAPGRDTNNVNFLIGQERENLVMYLRQAPKPDAPVDKAGKPKPDIERTLLCKLTEGEVNHIIVTYEPGRVTCYLNGKPVMETDTFEGPLEWPEPPFDTGLSFGGGGGWSGFGRPLWRGLIEGVAVYSRALSAEEAALDFASYAAILKSRPPVPHIEFRGKLTAKSAIPKLGDIAPYRDALIVYEYDVEKVYEAKLVGGTEETHAARIAELREKAGRFPAAAEADIVDNIGTSDLEHHVSINTANGKKTYQITFVPGRTLIGWSDVEARINGKPHKWEQLLKGIEFEVLPEILEVSIEGTTPAGRRLTASVDIRPARPEPGPTQKP